MSTATYAAAKGRAVPVPTGRRPATPPPIADGHFPAALHLQNAEGQVVQFIKDTK